MAGPSSLTLQEQLDKLNDLTFAELCKGDNRNEGLVKDLQRQLEILSAQISRQTSGQDEDLMAQFKKETERLSMAIDRMTSGQAVANVVAITEHEQGEAYLSQSELCASLLEELGDAADPTVVANAAAAVGAQLQKQPAGGDREEPVQKLLIAVLNNMSKSHAELLGQQPGGRKPFLVWDTHSTGLTVSSKAISAKPDALLCDRCEGAANVVSIIEAKKNLRSRSMQVEGAYQIAQRISQLQPSQPSRGSWWVGLIGADYVEIWHIQGDCKRRTGHLPLADQPDSDGLQALARLYCSDKQRLGYVPRSEPLPVRLLPPADKWVTFLGWLTIEHGSCSSNTSAAEVWRCTMDGLPVVLKSSNRIGFEIDAFDIVGGFARAIPHMPTKLGMGSSVDGRDWLAMPKYGHPFAGLRDPASIVAATKQAATGLGQLHEKGYLHGDISPYNIAVVLAVDGTTTTTIIDLATLRRLDDSKVSAQKAITGTPEFMAVEVLRGDVQTASSDLESLMYSFLYVATQGKLPWGPMTHDNITALYAKLACMTDPRLFDSRIVLHIGEPRLKAIAKNLRGLFFSEQHAPSASASQFIETLEMLA